MRKTITFNSFIQLIDNLGNITRSKLTNKQSVRRPMRSRRLISTYNQQKALFVGNRLHKEIIDRKILDWRIKQEIIVEQLLIRNRLNDKVNKIYRLSNPALLLLKQKLKN
jgi:hypothetical protein